MANIPNTYIAKKSQLKNIPIKEGIIYTSDTNELYITTKDGTRSKITNIITVEEGLTIYDILTPMSEKLYIFSDGSSYIYNNGWVKLNTNADTLNGKSDSYFQPAMFQGIDDLLNVSSNTIYYCNNAKNSPYANGLIDTSVGICISTYLSDSNNKYITLIYIPTGNSTIFVANISASSTSINWRKINDGGNADTVGGKSISDLLVKTNKYLAVEDTDFNTITDMGVYTIGTNNGSSMTESKNQPVGAYQWGTMVVFVSGGYGLTQVYYTHTGDTYVRGLYGGDNWNSWKKCGENADTLDGKHATAFYPQGSVGGSEELTINNGDGYNKIIAGNINIGWGASISKESDPSGICPSLFISEGRYVASYRQTYDYDKNTYSNNYSNERRTLSVGACATIVVAASDTYPESAKFSADYICNGTNDQNTINAAINNLLSSQGGKVILLNGTYNLSEVIKINRSNVTIEGMGYSTYLKCDRSVFKINTASSLSHISIKNLSVYTTGDYLLDFAYSSAINCSVTDLNLENITNDNNKSGCHMLLMKYNALTTTLVNYLTINNCKFLNSDEMVLNRCNNIIFTNNIVTSSEIFGIYYCNNAMVSNNKFYIYSLDTSNNTNVLIQNNLLTNYANIDSTNTNVSITNNLDI